MEGVGRACGWKHPRVPQISLLFEGERATPAVLTFLRGTKAGEFISLAALGGRVSGGGGLGGGGGRAPP